MEFYFVRTIRECKSYNPKIYIMNALEVTNTCRKKRQARLHSSVTQSSADINYRVLKKKDIDCQDYQHACARHAYDDLYSDEVDIAAIDETNFDDLALQSADSSNINYWEEPLSELAYNDDDDDDVPLFISKLTLVDFNLKKTIENEISNYMNKMDLWINNVNKNELLSINSTMTVVDFSTNFTAFCCKNEINKSVEEKLIRFLSVNVAGIQWPTREGKNHSLWSTIDSNVKPELPTLKFHLCPEFCIPFVGENKLLTKCPKCFARRFTDRSDELSTGTANAVITYRPILFWITELLKMKGFLPLFLHKYCKPSNDNKYKYSDISDGIAYQKALLEMETRYRTKLEDVEFRGKYPIMINFVLSQFLDGIQVWKSKVADFAPFVLGILNIPPSFRNKLGVGLFLCSLVTCKSNSGAEKFLFEHCLLQELQAFNQGVEIIIDSKTYFVQVRLKLTILDTAGLQAFIHVGSPQSSYWGCWSCLFHSVPAENTGTVYFGGHRAYLPLNHFLRSIGQTEQCCPTGYYLTDNDVRTCSYKKKTGSYRDALTKVEAIPTRGVFNYRKAKYCDPVVKDMVELYYNNKDKDGPFMENYHNILKTMKSLQFHVCDYRPVKTLTSISNKEFAEYTETFKEHYKEQCFMNGLDYFDLQTDVPYGSYHVFKNIASNLIECFKGNRAKRTNELIEYSEHTKTHLLHYQKDHQGIKAPWVYTNDEQNRIDAHVHCILIPSGLKNQFAIKNIFLHTGYLRCADLIVFLKILLNLVIFIVPKADYDIFYQLISEDTCDLLSPFFSEIDLDQLQNRLFETVAVHEGLFPITESRFSYHQLIHLVQNIKNWGPLSNSSEAAGERAIGIIKRYVPKKGGTGVDLTAIDRYIPKERNNAKDCYDFNFESYSNSKDYSYCTPETANLHKEKLNLRWNVFSDQGNANFNDNIIILSKHCNNLKTIKNTPYEFEKLVSTMVYIILNYYDDEIKREQSPLYRIHKAYKHLKLNKLFLNRTQIPTFGDLLCGLLEETLKTLISEEGMNYMNNINDLNLDFIDQIKANHKMYAEAYVYGTLFKSRGYEYRETNCPKQELGRYGQQIVNFIPSNDLNILKNHWKEKVTYSNWCSYKIHNKIQYGLVNYFFRLNVKDDPLLNNFPLASVCSYKFDNKLLKLPIISVNNFPFSSDAKLFIPLMSFCSSRILSLGLNALKVPILVKSRYKSDISEGINKHLSEIHTDIDTLLLLKLNPERNKCSFDKDAFVSGMYTDDSHDNDFAYSKQQA